MVGFYPSYPILKKASLLLILLMYTHQFIYLFIIYLLATYRVQPSLCYTLLTRRTVRVVA